MPIITDEVYRGALLILQRRMNHDDAGEALHRAVLVVLEQGIPVRLPQYLVRQAMWQHQMMLRRAGKVPQLAQRFGTSAMVPQLVERSTTPAQQLQICALSQALERIPATQRRWLADYIVPRGGVRGSLRRGRASRAIHALRDASQRRHRRPQESASC